MDAKVLRVEDSWVELKNLSSITPPSQMSPVWSFFFEQSEGVEKLVYYSAASVISVEVYNLIEEQKGSDDLLDSTTL